jgi:sensor histidine kinase YesM
LGGQKSIGAKLMIYNIILIVLVSIVVIISYLTSNIFSREYNRSSGLFWELSNFYQQMQSSRSNAQNYFYYMTEAKLIDYRSSMQAAETSLGFIMNAVDDADIMFRIRVLRNMMESCDEYFEKLAKNGSRPTHTGNYEYLMHVFDLTNSTQSEYYGYLIHYAEARREVLGSSWKRLTLIVSIVVSGMILSALFFSFSASRWVTRPINSIVSNIQKIKKGEYDLSEVKDSGPEFAVFGEALDDMANSIRANILTIETNARLQKQLLQAENENLRVNELLIMSELKALQDQMNPHFLFNTLTMISQIASMEQAKEAAELIDMTTQLLRYSLDKTNRMSTLFEELECVRNYLHIQRLRFGDRIHLELNTDPGVPNIMMPGMLLQPLIENAVIHGVGGMVHDAQVIVSVSWRNGNVYMTVEDNGKGIPQDKLEELLSSDSYPADANEKKGRHIGLLNAKKRIEMIYGSEAGFYVESTEDVGTLVTISIAANVERAGRG